MIVFDRGLLSWLMVALWGVLKIKHTQDFQIGYLAINKNGEIGAMSIHKGFNYAYYFENKNQLVDSKSYF